MGVRMQTHIIAVAVCFASSRGVSPEARILRARAITARPAMPVPAHGTDLARARRVINDSATGLRLLR